jgi:uncharacterized membrane protein
VGGMTQGYSEDIDKLRWMEIIEERYEKGEIKKGEYDKNEELVK